MAAGTIRRMLLVYTELVVMMQIRSRRPISDEVTLLDGSYAAAGISPLSPLSEFILMLSVQCMGLIQLHVHIPVFELLMSTP